MADIIYNLMRAKLLTLAALVMFLSCLAILLSIIVPFWMTLTVPLRIEDDNLNMTVDRTINTGLFFMDENRFINMLMLDKVENASMLPQLLKLAQVFYLLGFFGMLVCCASDMILAFRTFASTTGEMCLAAGVLPCTLCLCIAIILVFMSIFVDTDKPWYDIPVMDYVPDRYGYIKVPVSYPKISINWGTFVGCIGLALAISATVIIWIQATCTCKEYREHRYVMLREEPLYASPMPGKTQGFVNVARNFGP